MDSLVLCKASLGQELISRHVVLDGMEATEHTFSMVLISFEKHVPIEVTEMAGSVMFAIFSFLPSGAHSSQISYSLD